MTAEQLKVCNRTGQDIPIEWKTELHKAIKASYQFLDELEQSGYPYKRVSCVTLEISEYPYWVGESESEGRIHINPFQHDARAVAHEIGHGFEEKYRRKASEIMGQSMAEAIRFFVEKSMGESDWKPRQDWSVVLDACKKDRSKFNELLATGELHAKY